MAYNGIEIDMLSLGDADSILVTYWIQDQPIRILIDGGRPESFPVVRGFLRKMSVVHIDHLVCSHHHEDHAGGLVDLINDTSITFGKAWVHQPSLHVDMNSVQLAISTVKSRGLGLMVASIQKSLQTTNDVTDALDKRGR